MKNKLLSSLLLLLSFNVSASTLSNLVKNEISPIIVVDKSAAKMFVYFPQDGTVLSGPVLLGKVKGDHINLADFNINTNSPAITPAGTFWANKKFSAKLNESILSFVEGHISFIAIHPVFTKIPAERRLQRLTSSETYDNRISNGCINLGLEFFNVIYAMLPSRSKLIILPESDSVIDDISASPL